MSDTENPEEIDAPVTNKILSSIKVVLKSVSNLCNEGEEETVTNAKVCFRVGESGTDWKAKDILQATSTETGKKKDIQYQDETFNFNTAEIKSPELVVRVYGKDVKKDAEDEEEDEAGNKVKTFLGETIVIIQNDPTSVNMGEEEQTITLQDGSREDVVVVYAIEKVFIEPIKKTRRKEEAAQKIQAVTRGNQDRKKVEEKKQLLSSPPKPKKGEKENWLDDLDDVVKPAFGAGDHRKEVRKPKAKEVTTSGDAARAGKYDAKVVEHIFQTLEQMIESNIKARKSGFGARTLFGTHIHSILEVFVAMDVDKDGVLSRREFSRALKRLGVGVSEREVHMLFAQLDKNMNGSIEYGEFVDMFEQAEHNKDRLAVLKQEHKLGKEMSLKDKNDRENHIRLIQYMNTKGGKSKLKSPKKKRSSANESRNDKQQRREEMARAKFASFSMHADDEEMFLAPNDPEFKEALSMLRKVPRKPSNLDVPKTVAPNKLNPWVVFVMGGPGSSASALCAELARLRGFTYIEAQAIIREEIASESMLGRRMLQSISQGRVPIDATISIIMRAIMAASGTRVLVHGFPQDLEQAQTYEHAVGKCQAVLYVKCSRRLMQKRLLGTGSYGDFGNGEMDQTLTLQQARKRILDFEDTVEPVLTYFQLSSKVHVLRDGPALGKLITATDQLLTAYATPNRTFGTQTMTDDGGGGMTSLGNDEFDNSVGKMKEKPSPFIPASEQKQESKIGPNGETINFQRGGTPIQENVPKAPSGENTVGKSPLHNRATLRSRRGDPATEAGPRAELARWFSRIGIMVGAPDNWRREFSGGFLIAQCLEIYFPRAIQSKGFHTGSSTQYKRDNWRQLQQFFLKFNHPLDDSDIKDLLNAKKGKIVPFLLKVHFFISSQGLVDPLNNKPPVKGDSKKKGGDDSMLPSVLIGTQNSNKKNMRSGKGNASVSFQMDSTMGGVSGYGNSTRRR